MMVKRSQEMARVEVEEHEMQHAIDVEVRWWESAVARRQSVEASAASARVSRGTGTSRELGLHGAPGM